MAEVVGSYGLIEDLVTWKIAAGSDSYAGPFTLTGPAPGLVPMDLTNYTAACEVRTRVGETVLARLTTEDATITLGGAAGTVLVWLPAAVSEAWTPDIKKGVFDIELYGPGASVTALCSGVAAIRPNITKNA